MSKSRPIFSITIPVYNCEKEIGRLLDSIVNQNWDKDKLEVIACNDKSTDNCMEIIHSYDDKLNIVYCETPDDLKIHCPGNTRKEAIKYATGEWVTNIDNDDEFELGAFDKVYNHIKETNEQYMICADFREYIDGKPNRTFTGEEGNETWTHGKWFNLDNLIKKFNIEYKSDMTSHEDLYFNTLVLGHLIGNNTDYNYLTEWVYKWNYRPNSLSHLYYSDKYNYIETYLNDYLEACYIPNLDLIKVYPMKIDFYYNQLMMAVLHGYFYYQAAVWRLGFNDELNIKNRNHIKVMVDNICETLKITRNDMIDYIYKLPDRYMRVKYKSFTGSNYFVEVESFVDFMNHL